MGYGNGEHGEAGALMTDYDDGFKAASDSKKSGEDKSFAWQRGWAEAQE
jgi:hypothetical protein